MTSINVIVARRSPFSGKCETLSDSLKDIPLLWEDFFEGQKEYLLKISDEIGKFTRPNPYYVFECFHLTPLPLVRVVIIGQDPYPSIYDGLPAATGLAFSQLKVHGISRSITNIFKEIKDNYDGIKLNHSSLAKWARQGVLLINSSLTLSDNNESKTRHIKLWAPFIKDVLKEVYKTNNDCIFVAWGKDAQKVLSNSGVGGHHLTAGHPSPVNTSGGFKGCKHFIKINELITTHGKGREIDWSLQ